MAKHSVSKWDVAVVVFAVLAGIRALVALLGGNSIALVCRQMRKSLNPHPAASRDAGAADWGGVGALPSWERRRSERRRVRGHSTQQGRSPTRMTGLVFWVELRGFEPLASSLRTKRATNCATAPGCRGGVLRPRNSNTQMVAV
jgi:hypothetical protein